MHELKHESAQTDRRLKPRDYWKLKCKTHSHPTSTKTAASVRTETTHTHENLFTQDHGNTKTPHGNTKRLHNPSPLPVERGWTLERRRGRARALKQNEASAAQICERSIPKVGTQYSTCPIRFSSCLLFLHARLCFDLPSSGAPGTSFVERYEGRLIPFWPRRKEPT